MRRSRRGGLDDTDPRARAVQLELLRRMSPAELERVTATCTITSPRSRRAAGACSRRCTRFVSTL